MAGTAAFVYWKLVVDDKGMSSEKAKPISIASGLSGFDAQVATTLEAYLAMKDAFVSSDTARVNQAATGFGKSLQALDITQLKSDSLLADLAGKLHQQIIDANNKILAAAGIEAKRAPFETVSDKMFDLLRTVQYKGSKVYQQFCPMAFDDKGAAWLSADTEILNPYFGDKMLHCGEVLDSLRFSNP
jgi:Cu(I)/Ag(I) efflux system membrane fusion protein